MLLSEYKSKELLAQYNVAIPPGKLARTASEAEARCSEISALKYVVKAQIAAGGRGLAGGVKFAATPSSVHHEADALLGTRLVTEQTGPDGEEVNSVWIEAAVEIAEQFYIAIALEPETGSPLLLASSDGGVEFEQRAAMDAETVKTLTLTGDPVADGTSIPPFLAQIGIDNAGAAKQINAAVQAFVKNDLTLVEINPFAKTENGDWLAIDAKVALDPAAAFRHPEFDSLMSEPEQSDEAEAQQSNINYVKLDGSIGVIVNGAGLGLATNDMIIDAGGRPANFMDIRTTASSFDIARGVELLLKNKSVKTILLNVHGGGMTVCDTVAEGVAFAYSRSDRKPPCVARLAGVNADWGKSILTDRKVPVEHLDDMKTAIARAVATGGA